MANTHCSYKVLVADDHPLLRQGLHTVLSSLPDMEVIGDAGTGREAVDLAHRFHPDVVLMDVVMPEMDGIEATRLIKETMPQVRVIGLSMFEAEDVANQMKAVGAEAYLSKAEGSQALVKAIREHEPDCSAE